MTTLLVAVVPLVIGCVLGGVTGARIFAGCAARTHCPDCGSNLPGGAHRLRAQPDFVLAQALATTGQRPDAPRTRVEHAAPS